MKHENTDIADIHLTPSEQDWLVKLATADRKQITQDDDHPPLRAMNALVKKGMATCHQQTTWKITEDGRVRCTTIY